MKLRSLLFLIFALLVINLDAQLTNYAITPYTTGFETGTLDANWYTTSSAPGGRIRVHQTGVLTWSTQTAVSHTGNYFLGLDDSLGGTFHTQEAWMGLNLAGNQNVVIDFWWAEWNDETHIQDGVFFSDNGGNTFVKVLDLNGSSYTDLQWYSFSLNVDSLAQVHNLSLTSTFVVKFQQHDNYYFAGGNDGFLIDDISVSGLNPACQNDSAAPVAICQNLTVALPVAGVDTVDGTDVDNGSTDNCFINSYVLSQDVFTCADIGMNNVTLTLTDLSGNSSSCSATVMVTDSGNITALPVNIGADTSICESTTLPLDAGFPGSSYIWDTGDTTQVLNIGGGTHDVLVTNSLGCTGRDTIVINEIILPSSNPTPVNSPAVICDNQSITVVADSGFVSYLWITGTQGPSVTVMNGGVLTVTVTDANGCQRVDSLEIIDVNGPPPSAAITPTSPAYTCDGAPITLSATSGLSSYNWSSGGNTQSVSVGPGMYTITVTGPNGCQNISTAATEVRDTFATAPTLTVTTDSICATSATSYSWLLNGNPTGLTTQCIAPTVNGNYTCIVTNEFGCEADSSTSFMVGIADPVSVWQLQAAPNPFDEATQLTFVAPYSTEVTIDLYGLDGRLLKQVFTGDVVGGGNYAVDFKPATEMANGVYIYRLRTAEGESLSGRLILQR